MVEINSSVKSVTAFSPATCANVAVGFDILGFAFGCTGDEVTLTRTEREIKIVAIDAEDELPQDPKKNVASSVILKVCQDHGLDIGFNISIKKGIALGSGMGGSAASSVAALTALNAFLKNPLSLSELAQYAMHGEKVASGSAHADNVVPALYGGFTLTHCVDPIQVLQLPIPEVVCVLVHPNLRLDTKKARDILPENMCLSDYVMQSRHLSGFIASLYKQDISLLASSLKDSLIEPHRAQLIKGFTEVKAAALKAGALGASLAGSGPSIFAFAENLQAAETVSKEMVGAFSSQGVTANSWVGPIDSAGAKIIK